jgi:hypothetical protein
MTHLDDHLKKFLVLEVEDSLLADWESLLGELHGKLPGGNKETWILVCDLLRLFCLLYTDNSSKRLSRGAMGQGTTIKRKMKKCKLMRICKEYLEYLFSRGSVIKWPPGCGSGLITLNYGSKNPYFLSMTQRKLRKGQYFNFFSFN